MLNDLYLLHWICFNYVEWFVLHWMICTTLNDLYLLPWMICTMLNDLCYVERFVLCWMIRTTRNDLYLLRWMICTTLNDLYFVEWFVLRWMICTYYVECGLTTLNNLSLVEWFALLLNDLSVSSRKISLEDCPQNFLSHENLHNEHCPLRNPYPCENSSGENSCATNKKKMILKI